MTEKYHIILRYKLLLFEINFPSPPIPSWWFPDAWLTRGGGGTKIGQKGTGVCRITYAGAWPKFRKHVRKLRGDRSGIIGVLDRLSRRHRAMRSNRVSGGVDRDKLGFRSCRVGRSIDGFAVVKLVRWTWERLIAGRGYDYGRMKFVVELYTAFRNILGWNLENQNWPWSQFDSFRRKVSSVRYFEIEEKS